MREVYKSWQTHFDESVSGIREMEGPRLLETVPNLAIRSPGLTGLRIFKHQMGQNSLGSLSGLNKLSGLRLASSYDGGPPGDEIVWTDQDLEALRNMPALRTLGIHSPRIQSLQNLEGLQLRSLDLFLCTSLSNLNGLQGLPLARFCMVEAPLLTDAGLEGLRGTRLTDFELFQADLVTDGGLEVLRGMALSKLALRSCHRVTGAGLQVFHGMLLWHLDLQWCRRLDLAACVGVLRGFRLTQLTELTLSACCEGVLDDCLDVREFTDSKLSKYCVSCLPIY